MPTGYTAEVAEGKVTDFRTFALRCARQFGATIMQRDDPMDVPPKLREESSYYATALVTAEAQVAQLAAMTLTEADRAAAAEHTHAVAERAKAAVRHTEIRNRYNAMLADVMAWVPPSPDHGPMKQFMIDQLVESRKWDCGDFSDPPVRMTAAAWLATARAKAAHDVAYYSGEVQKERARVEGANAWITALYESLPATAAV